MRATVVPRYVLAAAVLVAAAAVAVPAAPASAAACSSGTGATVVVDFNQLGGGVREICDTDGGGDYAYSLFEEHFELTQVQRQPGFVCRINGLPSTDAEPCVDTPPSDAYWSLYWSDGKSGRWSYSSAGAGGLKIPEGGYVAFSWKQGSAAAPPSATPTPHAAPSPTQEPTPGGDGADGGGDDGDGGDGRRGGNDGDGDVPASETPSPSATESSPTPSASASDAPTTKASAKPRRTPKPTPSASETPTPATSQTDDPAEADDDLAPTASPPDAGGDGLPAWLAPGLIVVLFAAAGATALLRRRRAS
jgi:hypothetical protein